MITIWCNGNKICNIWNASFSIKMWCLEITSHRLTLFWSSDLPGQARVASMPNLHFTCSQFTSLPHICSFDINCLGDTSSVPARVAFFFHQSFFTPLLPMCPHWSVLPLFPKGYITSLLIVRRKEFCSQKLDSSLLGVWHWWAPGSVRKSKSILVWVNGKNTSTQRELTWLNQKKVV